jgi:hypothetical protein
LLSETLPDFKGSHGAGFLVSSRGLMFVVLIVASFQSQGPEFAQISSSDAIGAFI